MSRLSAMMTRAVLGGAVTVATLAPAAAWSPPKRKDCFEGFSTANGCPWQGNLREPEMRALSCENLAHIRNRIYDQNGYCFQKPDLKKQYNADGCKWPILVLVPLNRFERANVTTIKKVEKAKRCG